MSYISERSLTGLLRTRTGKRTKSLELVDAGYLPDMEEDCGGLRQWDIAQLVNYPAFWYAWDNKYHFPNIETYYALGSMCKDGLPSPFYSEQRTPDVVFTALCNWSAHPGIYEYAKQVEEEMGMKPRPRVMARSYIEFKIGLMEDRPLRHTMRISHKKYYITDLNLLARALGMSPMHIRLRVAPETYDAIRKLIVPRIPMAWLTTWGAWPVRYDLGPSPQLLRALEQTKVPDYTTQYLGEELFDNPNKYLRWPKKNEA